MILNVIGLVCGMVGSVLIFVYGLPPSISKAGQYVLDEPSEDEKNTQIRYRNFSRFGLFLLFMAFLLQLISILSW